MTHQFAAENPPRGKLIGNEVGYYLRTGDHDFTQGNWDALIQFASARLE